MTSIKPEPGQLLESKIKPDPDSIGNSPAPQTDEDIYEDTGDLDFAGSDQGFYLTRLPKFLWDNWSKLDDNQEIQVGTIRVEGGLNDVKRMSLMLLPHIAPNLDAKNREVPKEYNLRITDPQPVNTFIFTEKDLPGYKKYSHDRAPPRYKDRRRIEKPKKADAYFRRAIPKQTNLAGQVRTEINCLPVENQEHQEYLEKLAFETLNKRPKTQFIENPLAASGGSLLNPGVLGPAGNFGSFTTNAVPNKVRKQENKATRMPQDQLLDALFNCFKEFKYWPLSALKSRLNQPESYLKETLEKIAVLIKGGTFNLTYQLRPDSTEGRYLNFDDVKAEAAPDVGSDRGEDLNSNEEDDENVKMEDVFLG